MPSCFSELSRAKSWQHEEAGRRSYVQEWGRAHTWKEHSRQCRSELLQTMRFAASGESNGESAWDVEREGGPAATLRHGTMNIWRTAEDKNAVTGLSADNICRTAPPR